MQLTCAKCGYASAAISFFREEKDEAAGGKRQFCRACEPYRRTALDKATRAHVVIAACLLPLGLLLFSIPEMLPLALSATVLGTMSALRPLTIAVHEFGHYCAARAVGYRVARVAIGTGPAMTARAIGGTVWELRRFLFSGGQTLSFAQSRQPRKWRHAVKVSGGVAGNALLGAAFVAALIPLLRDAPKPPPVLFSLLFGGLGAQVMTIVFSLWPRRLSGQPGVTGTDGQLLVDLYRLRDFPAAIATQQIYGENRELLRKGHYGEAAEWCEERRRERPEDAALFSSLLHALERAYGARRAFDYYRAHVGEVNLKDRARAAWVCANAAWHALLTGDASLLGEADRLSQQAFEQQATPPEIRATRGAYLTRSGDHERGLPLLLDGIRRAEDDADRANFALFLQGCSEGLGSSEDAVEYAKLALHLKERARQRIDDVRVGRAY